MDKTNERKSPAYLAASKIVQDVCRYIKQNNPKAVMGWTGDDMDSATQGFVDEYLVKDFESGIGMMRQAFQRLKVLSCERGGITFGDYNAILYALQKQHDALKGCSQGTMGRNYAEQWRATNPEHLENVANAPKGNSEAIKKYWLGVIRKTLKNSGMGQGLADHFT